MIFAVEVERGFTGMEDNAPGAEPGCPALQFAKNKTTNAIVCMARYYCHAPDLDFVSRNDMEATGTDDLVSVPRGQVDGGAFRFVLTTGVLATPRLPQNAPAKIAVTCELRSGVGFADFDVWFPLRYQAMISFTISPRTSVRRSFRPRCI